jgi:hypothetical protein
MAIPLGSLAAYGLVRGDFPGKGCITYLIPSPLVIPVIITAVPGSGIVSRTVHSSTTLAYCLSREAGNLAARVPSRTQVSRLATTSSAFSSPYSTSWNFMPWRMRITHPVGDCISISFEELYVA